MHTPDNYSSSSEEPPDSPNFGQCMFCHARGFVHTNCNECDSLFEPIKASPLGDDSSGIQEQQETQDPALDHVRRTIMAAFNTDRVSDNTCRQMLFLQSLGDHRVASEYEELLGHEDFFRSGRPPSAQQDVPSQVVMEEERMESEKRDEHYNAAGAVCDVTAMSESDKE